MNKTIEAPEYIKSLLTPIATKQPQKRKVWSIDLESVVLPFFVASNTTGNTAIPSEAIGCPLRLGYDKNTGEVLFSKKGKPVIRVVKEINDGVNMIRENLVKNMANYAHKIASEMPEEYNATVKQAVDAGKPILQNDQKQLNHAVKARAEAEADAILKANAEAEAKKAEATEAQAEAHSIVNSGELVTA